MIKCFNLLKGFEIKPVALPVPRDSAARLATMQAITESTRPRVEFPPQFRKQTAEFPRIIRKIRSIETRGVSYSSVLTQLVDLHMAGDVTTAPEAS